MNTKRSETDPWEIVNTIDEEYPLFLTPENLIELGLFPDKKTITRYIKRESAYVPEHIRMGNKKILFPKEAVIDFIMGIVKPRDEV